MTRIGVLTAALGGGGAERQALIWARICASQGHDVTAMPLWWAEDDVEPDGVQVVCLSKGSGSDLARTAWNLRRLQQKLDVLIVFEPYLAVCALLARLSIPWMVVTGKVPYVLGEGTRIPMPAFRRAFDKAALASAPNQAMVDSYRQLGIRPERPWVVVPNVTDPAAFIEYDGERSGVLWVGRFETVKNPILAIESTVAAEAPLTLLGYGSLQPEVEATIAARNGGPPIDLRPFNGKPWLDYARHRVLLVTSLYESFGNVIVESLAAGTPVVSVDCDFGPREIIGDADFSRLTAPRVGEIASALREVLSRPPSEAEASEGRTIASRYRPEAVEPQVAAAIEHLLSTTP